MRNARHKFQINIVRKNNNPHEHLQKGRGDHDVSRSLMRAFAALAQLIETGDKTAIIRVWAYTRTRENGMIEERKQEVLCTNVINLMEWPASAYAKVQNS